MRRRKADRALVHPKTILGKGLAGRLRTEVAEYHDIRQPAKTVINRWNALTRTSRNYDPSSRCRFIRSARDTRSDAPAPHSGISVILEPLPAVSQVSVSLLVVQGVAGSAAGSRPPDSLPRGRRLRGLWSRLLDRESVLKNSRSSSERAEQFYEEEIVVNLLFARSRALVVDLVLILEPEALAKWLDSR